MAVLSPDASHVILTDEQCDAFIAHCVKRKIGYSQPHLRDFEYLCKHYRDSPLKEEFAWKSGQVAAEIERRKMVGRENPIAPIQ